MRRGEGEPAVHLDRESCYAALAARDRRFDGVFFNGVKTTGIYCRTICPARTPMFERCRFFPTAAAAEAAGYRACLQCRPELAPGALPCASAPPLLAAAVANIASGVLHAQGADALATSVGASRRELDALCERELGASLEQIARTQRLGLAKRLLTDTALTAREIAELSGFETARRLQRAIEAYLGRTVPRTAKSRELCLRLDYRPPFDAAAVFDFLRARSAPGLERVEGQLYRRSIRLGELRGWLSVEPHPKRDALVATVSPSLGSQLLPLMAAVRALFDLDAEPDRIGACLGRDPQLSAQVAARPGLRVPGAVCPFEVAVRAVLGQQISVAAATTLCGRLLQRFGDPVETPWPEIRHVFPTPAKLVEVGVDGIASLGMPRSRAATLYELARAVVEERVELSAAIDPELAVAALRRVPGIGPWTAQYIAMRVLHWPDAFPAGDLGVRKALGMPSTAAAERSAQSWRPFRAYAVMHFWLAHA